MKELRGGCFPGCISPPVGEVAMKELRESRLQVEVECNIIRSIHEGIESKPDPLPVNTGVFTGEVSMKELRAPLWLPDNHTRHIEVSMKELREVSGSIIKGRVEEVSMKELRVFKELRGVKM